MSRFVALGVFDGVHVGHRTILSAMVKGARKAGVASAVVTFEPHPDGVIRGGGGPPLLTPWKEKEQMVLESGVDEMVTLTFSPALARLSAHAFLEDILLPRLGPAEVFVGYNFTFGHKGAGDADLLREEGSRLGFKVHVVPPVTIGGEVVSSTLIRRRLGDGDVQWAARALGRPYRVYGTVTAGDGRGSSLGYPTANVTMPPEKCRPGRGVYAVSVGIPDKEQATYVGVANVGRRPTFAGTVPEDAGDRLEVHALNFEGDLYDKEVRVGFIQRLRGEVAFPSVAELKRQIARDVEAARLVFRRGTVTSCSERFIQVE